MITIAQERPDTPDAQRLLHDLDTYLFARYPAEARHILSISELLAADVTFFVARFDGVAIGCGAIRISGDEAELKRFYVQPAHRRGRVSRALLDARVAHAADRGVRIVRLETGIHQPEAIALFERAGFRQTGPFGAYVENGLSVFFEKTIG